ncbi:hypothetical protein DZC52_01365 [Wenzhouxiangella sediminis]|uniref:Fibronectin type-III domain-containing protein n=2 Tax=Wenzhouxiangella sediminis TaxID=1792836 RepID=A0A3E1KCI4_9GAMM|nr:hypothetical protein DZC52_01365 [Wenzhouxiangella sediminis]
MSGPVLGDVILPEDYPPQGLEAPQALRNVDDYFGPVERHGNLLTTATEWPLDSYVEDELNVAIRQALTEIVIGNQGDRFDFVMVLTTFPIELRSEELAANGMYWSVSNAVEGIGLPAFDQSADWGSSGRLQGFIDLGQASAERLFPQSREYQYLLTTAAHELMHRWSSYVGYMDSGTIKADLLGHADSHWNSLLDTQASVMYGHDWIEQGESEYQSGPVTRRYSALDLYLAGLADSSEVPPMLRLRSPQPDVPEFPEAGLSIEADPEWIAIENVIDAEGPRVPGVVESQKHFRAALVIVRRPEESIPAGLMASVERLRRDIQERFSSLVGGRAVLHIVPESVARAAPGLPHPLEGSTPSQTPEVAVGLALDWLEQVQGLQGFWTDREGSRWRDTASAVQAFRMLRPGSSALPVAEAAALEANPDTLEALAWRARALPGESGKDAETVEQLLALQRSDGGWGLTVQHQSSVEDTAGVLKAFWDVMPEHASSEALEFVAGAQNVDGGWGSYPGAQTHFPPTLSAIEALSLPIATHSEALQSGRDWLASRHRPSGEFRHEGEMFAPGGAARALALLIGHDVDPLLFDSTASWLSRQQGESGDWSGSAFSTASAILVLGRLELPNLQIDGQPSAQPETPIVGSLLQLSARVANSGRETAPPSTTRWYLGDPREGGTAISGPIQVPELPAGSSQLVEFLWETDSQPGEQDVWVAVEGQAGLEEWTLEDNYRHLPILVSDPPEGPELALHPSAISVSPAAIDSVPTEVQVTGTLWNHGGTSVNDTALVLIDTQSAPPTILAETFVDAPAGGESAFDVSFEYDGSQSSQLLLAADPNGLVADADRSNNEAEVGLTVSTGIDVAVESIALEPEEAPYAGHPLEIRVELANRGLAAAPSFAVDIDVLDSEGQPVHEATTSLSMDSLSSTFRNVDWQPATPGIYTVSVQADPEALLDDVDPLNNELEASFEVTVAEGMNLRLDPLSVLALPDPGVEGDAFNVTATVHSDGGEAVPAFSLGLFDGDPRSGGQLLGDVVYDNGLAPGESVDLNIQVDEFGLRGQQTLWLQADRLDEVSETDELDNLHAFDHQVLSLPDLMVQASDFSIDPAAPIPGEPVTLDTRIHNLGEQPADSVRFDLLEISPEGQSLIESRIVDEVAGEGFVTVSWSWTLGAVEDPERLRVVVDPEAEIPELSEANNESDLSLAAGEGPLFTTNRYFSPNGDGVKDDTLLVFRVEEALEVELIVERPGEVVRRFTEFAEDPVDRGQLRWDGRDDFGSVVVDGDYLVRLRSGNQDLASTVVTVDTDRSPLIRAHNFARVFHNQVEGFRQDNYEPIRVTDPELGPAYVVIDPYSVGQNSTLNGVYKSGVRRLDPVVTDQWIQDRADLTGIPFEPVDIAYDGGRRLAILAEEDGQYQIWLTDLSSVDSVAMFDVPVNDGDSLTLSGFGHAGRIILHHSAGSTDGSHFSALDPDSGQFVETVQLDWAPTRDQYSHLSEGVLVHGNGELAFFDFQGGSEVLDVQATDWPSFRADVAASGRYAAVHFADDLEEAVFLFSQDDRTLEELSRVESIPHFLGAEIYGPEGAPIQVDATVLGMSWSPTQEILAVANAVSGEISMVLAQQQEVLNFAIPLIQPEYSETMTIDGEGSLERQWRFRAIQDIATKVGPPEDCCDAPHSDGSAGSPPGGGLEMREGQPLKWDDRGERLMFALSDVIHAESDGYQVRVPGRSTLFTFERLSSEIEAVRSDSLWPYEGQSGRSLMPDSSHYGFGLHLVHPFRIPRFYWWSAGRPQEWLEPLGPYYVESFWSGEAGYVLVDEACATPDGAWGTECLPTPVLNLDRPTTWLSAVLAAEDLDLGGFATDRNLESWRIDMSPGDGQAAWQAVAGWTPSAVIDSRFLRWPPSVSGPVLLRLELADKAGNRHQATRRAILPVDPQEPVIELSTADPRLISPNGDGIKDATVLEYEAVLADPFYLRVFDLAGTEVFNQLVSHLPGELGTQLIEWGGDSHAGPVVADGEYSLELWRYLVPVAIDNTPPAVQVEEVVAPFLEKDASRDTRLAMVRSEISDQSIAEVIMESRLREGSLQWSEFRSIGDLNWIGISNSDFAAREFRIRAEDSAGNVTYGSVPWPGDYLMLMGVEDDEGRVHPDPTRKSLVFDPAIFNDESSDTVSWASKVSLTETDSLRLDALDLSLDRIDDLHIEFRAAGENEWQSYEVPPDEVRDGWAALPLDQIPAARMEARLRSSQPDLVSNLASLDLSYVGVPECIASYHEGFFEETDIAVAENDIVVFWQAYSSPDFQDRELRHVRPGQPPRTLEPVLVGSKGARAYVVRDVGSGEQTFVYRVRFDDGSERSRTVSFGCGSQAVPLPTCFNPSEHAGWFPDAIPDVDPLTHSRVFWRPHPGSDYPFAELFSEGAAGDQLVLPSLTGQDGARLYLLDKSSNYHAQLEIAESSNVVEYSVDTTCVQHVPIVRVHSLPALDCNTNAGGVRVSLLPPGDSAYPEEYAHVRSELQTMGGNVLSVLFDESAPEPFVPSGSDCPRPELLARGEVLLDDLAAGNYRIVTVTTSEQGNVWRDVKSIPVYAQAPSQDINAPQDQALVCVDESHPVIGVDHQFLDARLAPAMVEAWGHPSMVGPEGYRLEYSDVIRPDERSLNENLLGECEPNLSTPISLEAAPWASEKVSPFELYSLPGSPQSVTGVLDLNFSRVDRAGGRSCEARRVGVDSRVEAVNLGARPIQAWSQRQTAMLTLNGAASLRKFLYSGGTHEPLKLFMQVHPAVVDAQGDWVPAEPPVHIFDPLDIEGPASPELSPAEFVLEWNGQLDDGWVEDGFYFLVPSFQDGCRVSEFDGELVEVDSTSPLIEIESPQPSQTIETSLIEVIGSISDKYFERYEVSFGVGASPATWTLLSESEVEAPEPETLALGEVSGLDGPGVIRVRASDLLGNQSELLVPVTFDTPPPLIEMLTVNPKLFGPTGNGSLDSTAIGFSLAEAASVNLIVADAQENRLLDVLADEGFDQGAHTIEWDGEDAQDVVLPDGRYRVLISAQALDDADHIGEAGHDVVIDTTAPQLEFLYPDAPHIKGEGLAEIGFEELHPYLLSFELLDADDNPVDSGEVAQPSSQEEYGLVALDELDEGEYRLEVEAVDRAGNSSEANQTFVVDRTPPDIALGTPGEGDHLMVGKVYDVTGEVDDDHLTGWQLAVAVESEEPDWQVLHESNALPESSDLHEWLVDLPDGAYLFRLQAVDRAGNESEITRAFVVDGMPPEAQIASPESHAWAGPELEVIGTAQDLNLGAYRMSMASLDNGEVSGDWLEIAFSEQGVAGSVLAATTPTAASGAYRLHLEAWDRAGNVGESTLDFNYAGMTPPPPTGLVAQVENQQDVRLSWQAPVHAVPLAGFNVYRNGELLTATPVLSTGMIDPGLVEGSYQYTVTALDEAGNESAPSVPANVIINLAAPTVQISSPAPASRVRGLVDVSGTAYSAEGFDSYKLWVQPSSGPAQLVQQSASPVLGGTLAVWNTTGLPDESEVSLMLEAEDTFGNAASVSVNVVIDNFAPQAPTGLVAEIVDDENVQLDWNPGSEPDLLGYLLYRNGDPVNWSGNLPDDLRLLALPDIAFLDEAVPDGLHAYRVFAIDEAGNVSPPSEPAEVELDRRPPAMTIVEPLSGHAFDESVRVTADSEDLDIAEVQFAWRAEGDVDWTNLGDPVSQRPYRRVWTPGELAWGEYEIRALASDTGGLTDPEPPVVAVQYADLTPPQIPLALSAAVDGTEVSLTWQAVPDDDLAGYRVYRGEFGFVMIAGPIEATEYVHTVGWNEWDDIREIGYRITAVDEAGNESEPSATVEVTVHEPELDQPYTPTPFPVTNLYGLSRVAGTTSGGVTAASDSQALPEVAVAEAAEFSLEAVGLFPGDNQITLQIEDSGGDRSIPATVNVTHGLPPEPPEGLVLADSGDVLSADWDDHVDPDVIGYRLFLNGNAIPADEPSPVPTDASTNYGDPWRALDGDPGSAWGDNYYHYESRRPYIEIEFAQPLIVTAVDLDWLPDRQGVDFNVLGWSGDVWSPLTQVRGNDEAENTLHLPMPYRTDRLRVEILELEQTGSDALGLRELELLVRPLLGDSEWQSEALMDGLYEVEVTAINGFGFESERSDAVEAGIGDVQPPESVVLTAAVDGSDVLLDWTESVSDNVAYYSLHRDGEEIVQVAVGEPTNHWDQALPNGSYSYVVYAVSEAGVPSLPSNTQSVQIDVQAPAAPVDLVVTSPAAGNALQIDWAGGPGPAPASYRLSRALAEEGSFELVVEQSATAYLDQPLDNGVTYYYVVEALDGIGNASGQSGVASGTPANVVAPSPPIFLYPGMIGETVDVAQSPQSFSGTAQAGSIIELWRDETLFASVSTIHAPEASWLTAPDSEVGIESTIVSDGEWVWAPMQGQDRIFNTRDGSTLGPWPESANRAVWDSANADLWRRLSGPDVYQRVDLDSGETEVLDTPLQTIEFASPAPDGVWALLAGYLAQGQPFGMFRWNRHSGDVEELEATEYSDFHVNTHVWSPDSTRVAWVRSDRLRVMDLTAGTFVEYGTDIRRVRPSWSPDGRFLAVVTGPDGNTGVEVFDTETGTAWQPPLAADSQSIPTWNHDGSRLLLLQGSEGRVVAFPSGEVIEQLDFAPVMQAFDAISWQRFSEILAVSESNGRLALLRPTGWFRMDEVEVHAGDNVFRGFAVDADGNASVPSGDLTVVLDEQAVPDLTIAADDLVVEPAAGMPGEAFVASAVIGNTGGAASPQTQALMVLTTPSVTGQSVLLEVPPLQAGAETTIEWELGELATEGVHELLIEIDPLVELNESSRSNNFAERSFVVGEPGEPAFDVLMASEFLAPGQSLNAELKLVNPGPEFSGHVDLQIRDAGGVLVAELDGRTIDTLPAGETWYSPVSWETEGVLAGQYALHATLHDAFGVELQEVVRAFNVQLDAQVEMTLAPEFGVVAKDEMAKILTGVEIVHSNGVVVDAGLELVAANAAGQEVRRWERNLGTILAGYRSSETISWPLEDIQTGTYELRLELSGPSILRTAVSSLTVVESAGAEELTGSVAFTQAPLSLGYSPGVAWEVQAPADTAYSDLPLRLTLATLPDGSALEVVEQDVAVDAGESSSGETAFASVLADQGDYAVTLEAWSEEASTWMPLASDSASALDLGAPVIEITDPAAGEIVRNPIGLAAVVTDSYSPIDEAAYRLGEDGPWIALFESGLGGYVASLETLEEGQHELRVRATDTAGNLSISAPRVFTVDDTPPEILVSGVSDGSIESTTVAPMIDVTDTHLDEVTITLDGESYISGTTIDEEGAHLLQVVASDLAGNTSQVTLQFELDFTPPDIAFVEPEEGATLLNGEVEAVLQTEPGAEVSVSRGAFQAETTADAQGLAVFESVSLELGENRIEASVLDSAGNQSDPVERMVEWLPPSGVLEGTIVPDALEFPADAQVAGVIELHNPAEEGLSNLAYRFRVSHEDVGEPLSEWYGDGDVPAGSTAEFGWNFASAGWPLGELTLVLEIQEGEDWIELDSRVVVLADVLPPDVLLRSPSAGQVVGGALNVLAEAVDEHSGIAMVELSLAGGAWQAMLPDAGVPDHYRADLQDLPKGDLELAVRGVDEWGNEAGVGPVEFVVDRTAPVISIGGVDDGQVGNEPVTPVIQVKDAHDVESQVQLDGEPFDSGTEVSAEGIYVLWVSAEDEAGNESETQIQFEIDLTTPTIEFTHPDPGDAIATGTVLLSGVTEPRSQVHLTGPSGEVTTHANEQGEFQVPDWPLQVGLNTIVGEAIDPAGNEGAPAQLEISYLPEDALFHDRFEALGLLFRTALLMPGRLTGADTWAKANDWEATRQ